MIAAIIPVKTLAQAKSRLGTLLSARERRALVLAMLGDVLASLCMAHRVDRVGVISADPVVLAHASARGAEVLTDHTPDLNTALAQAAAYYAARGATAALVLPADVPLIQSYEIDELIAAHTSPGLMIAPSSDGGTNALLVGPPLALPFLFGAGSLARHLEAARARELRTDVFQSPGLEIDVDRPDDLLLLAESDGETETQRLARDLCVAERVMCV
ncbi:MAG TPA: 2-phospho-L-lactate guanylyltransferase [Roseiflexaceae bacterium]|nr:2-phospho-L-lactate guanylyltransferase [Roseiflexaceae bacterium]